MKPEEVLEKLKQNVTQKTKDTLDAIYEICKEQQERGLDDYSIASIAKLGTRRGVPKAQSIRNKSGESYRALLLAFSESAPKKKTYVVSKKDEDWIDEISNPKHKLLVRMMASELKMANEKLKEISPPSHRIDVYDHKSKAPPPVKLNELERRALEHLISQQFQSKWNVMPTEHGEYVNNKGEVIFKSATLDAIKKALENM